MNLGSKVSSIWGKSNDRALSRGFRVLACSPLRQNAGGGQMGVGLTGGDAKRRVYAARVFLVWLFSFFF